MSVYTHAYLQAHMRTHYRGSEISVSGQKRKRLEEWFVAGCQQLWARGQSMPLCPSLQNRPYSLWNLLVYTLGLFCGAGSPWQGSRRCREFSWRGESLRFQFTVSRVILSMRIWGRFSGRAAVHRGGATCTGKAIFALASECQGEPCGLEASTLRVLLGAS